MYDFVHSWRIMYEFLYTTRIARKSEVCGTNTLMFVSLPSRKFMVCKIMVPFSFLTVTMYRVDSHG